jgi:hypothetical protein
VQPLWLWAFIQIGLDAVILNRDTVDLNKSCKNVEGGGPLTFGLFLARRWGPVVAFCGELQIIIPDVQRHAKSLLTSIQVYRGVKIAPATVLEHLKQHINLSPTPSSHGLAVMERLRSYP